MFTRSRFDDENKACMDSLKRLINLCENNQEADRNKYLSIIRELFKNELIQKKQTILDRFKTICEIANCFKSVDLVGMSAHEEIFEEKIKQDELQKTHTDKRIKCNGIPYSEGFEHLANNCESSGFSLSYANASDELISEAVQIGNQKLISFDDKQIEGDFEFCSQYTKEQFSFILDFLKKHKTIKYIVDIGCGDCTKSLKTQKYLISSGFQDVRIFPVDNNLNSKLPMNVIDAKAIEGANPADIMFLCIFPYTDPVLQYIRSKKSNQLFSIQNGEEYYITKRIKNNP